MCLAELKHTLTLGHVTRQWFDNTSHVTWIPQHFHVRILSWCQFLDIWRKLIPGRAPGVAPVGQGWRTEVLVGLLSPNGAIYLADDRRWKLYFDMESPIMTSPYVRSLRVGNRSKSFWGFTLPLLYVRPRTCSRCWLLPFPETLISSSRSMTDWLASNLSRCRHLSVCLDLTSAMATVANA